MSINQADRYQGTGSAKCPNCAANIFYNEKLSKLICSMCGGIFDPSSLKPVGRIENRDTEESGEQEDNKQEFICDSCGAAVVTDYNTAATFCAFCGSPTLIKRRLSKCFRPDVIIPFKVSKEEAIDNYLEWAKTHKGIPKKFVSESVLEKITGYYIPFWLIDADCKAEVTGTGQKFHGQDIENFKIDRTLVYKVTRVPFDGCKKIANTLMEAIEPFDYSELKEYNDMYLPGFFAQRYDVSALDMIDLIRIRFDNYAEGIVQRFSAGEYDSFKALNTPGTHSENYSQIYAMMPVWFLNIEYEGSTYGIAVNGQTGKASGSLPISKKRVHVHALGRLVKDVLKYVGLSLIVPALVPLFIYSLTSGKVSETYYMTAFLICWAAIFLLGLIFFIPFLKSKFSDDSFYESVTIDKAPNIEQYIDFNTKFNMEKRDSFLYMSGKWYDDGTKRFERGSIIGRILNNIFK